MNEKEIRPGFKLIPAGVERSARRHDHKPPWEPNRYLTRRCVEKIDEEVGEVKDALKDWQEWPSKLNARALIMEIEDAWLSLYMLYSKVAPEAQNFVRGRDHDTR